MCVCVCVCACTRACAWGGGTGYQGGRGRVEGRVHGEGGHAIREGGEGLKAKVQRSVLSWVG